jgi:transposase
MALLEQQIADLDQHMGALVTPLQPQLAQLDSIPGVDRIAAREIIAEIGVDMRRFGSAGRFAAWARVSPGNNESAGKRRSGRTGKGHRYVRRLLVQWAWAARKTPTFLGRTFRRLEGRLGKKKAAVAIAHTILVLGYPLLAEGTYYDEQRDAHLQPQQENRWQRHAVETLERLGSRVVLEKIAEKPGDSHHRAPSRWEGFCSGHAPETAKRGMVCLFGRRYFMGNSSSA